MNNLLLSIARCGDVSNAMRDNKHPCHEIVSSQNDSPFQIPEPWNGNLQNAKILFISSNPSISSLEIEEYPTESWADEEIQEFFLYRFSIPYYRDKVRFWTFVKKYSSWVLDMDVNDKALASNICITEVVHCKSRSERGVPECCDYCADKWLNRILSEFNGHFIILLGTKAKRYEAQVRESGKLVLWMPHPVSGKWTDEKRKSVINDWKKTAPTSK